MWEYYRMYMHPFGQVLTNMECRGTHVNAKECLALVEYKYTARFPNNYKHVKTNVISSRCHAIAFHDQTHSSFSPPPPPLSCLPPHNSNFQ